MTREPLEPLLDEVARLRMLLDELWIEDRVGADEKLDMAFAALQEWVTSPQQELAGRESRVQLRSILKDLHRALCDWRAKLADSADIPSMLEGKLRDLQDTVMRLIAS